VDGLILVGAAGQAIGAIGQSPAAAAAYSVGATNLTFAMPLRHFRVPLLSVALAALITVPGYVGVQLLFPGPRGAFDFSQTSTLVDVAAYFVTCCLMIAFGWAMRRLAADLADVDRRKNEFLATLAHELRNPLAPLTSALEILKRTGAEPHTLARSVATMERQLGQMVRLVDDLLDVSRITHDRLELRQERIALAAVIEDALEACRPLADAAGQRIVVHLPAAAVHVQADRARLTQVFANLLSNACKYTPRGGLITLSAERQDGEVVVAVEDNGIGIPRERLDGIFGLFEQVDRSARSQGGLGIGLTLVRRLVQMHGGMVHAESAGSGRGSRFIVRLPAVNEARTPAHAAPAAEEKPAAAARRILVVDDNRDAAFTLAALLRISGHEVHMAHDGAEALAIAEKMRPDLLVLDIGMPVLNGHEVCRRLRAEPWGADATVVALTGWGQDDDRARSREAGFDYHFVKPVNFAALDELLRSLPAPNRGRTQI
jgi:signal transduction histidine kinase/ActR/RegA family two-component response regulator